MYDLSIYFPGRILMTDRPRRGRGRRPADEVRKEILDAAAELLFAEGMGGFTIEKVANLSGASKMTIYKWWPSKGALALDGYFQGRSPAGLPGHRRHRKRPARAVAFVPAGHPRRSGGPGGRRTDRPGSVRS